LFLLYTNRCGSNFVAQALASTGELNEAGEFFNADAILAHSRRLQLVSLQDYFCRLPELIPCDGWLASKLAVVHVDILREAGILDAVLGRSHFILLDRQDELAQAISRCIAWQNQRWTSEQPRSIPDEALDYAREHIDQQIRQIQFEKGRLYRFMADVGGKPIHFTYEAFVAQPQRHLDEIAARLGLPAMQLDRSRIRITRQSNHVNDAWRARYLAGD
jgi:LPS sulfotransferase NodH